MHLHEPVFVGTLHSADGVWHALCNHEQALAWPESPSHNVTLLLPGRLPIPSVGSRSEASARQTNKDEAAVLTNVAQNLSSSEAFLAMWIVVPHAAGQVIWVGSSTRRVHVALPAGC